VHFVLKNVHFVAKTTKKLGGGDKVEQLNKREFSEGGISRD